MAPPIPPERIESMRCFVHHDHEAVGICRACSKGLCPDCSVDLGHSISCRGDCEKKAQKMHTEFVRGMAMMNRSEAILNAQRRNRFFVPVYLFFLGAIMIGFGFNYVPDPPSNFVVAVGVVIIVFGIVRLVLNQRMYKTIDRNPS